MHSKSDNIKIAIGNNANEEFINELFSSLLTRHQIGLVT